MLVSDYFLLYPFGIFSKPCYNIIIIKLEVRMEQEQKETFVNFTFSTHTATLHALQLKLQT
ncbi:MAG: hypothetical protein B6242_17415 [Anaerolineaceae bacterium 4572_78]|nr:MAG: hypothetical protein B6242_17415 [Anaerolineaceae bacterium 4572_78]